MRSNLQDIRRNKIKLWPKLIDFSPNNSCNIVNLEIDNEISIAGRIVFFRDLGKIVFGKLRDFNGTAQFSLTSEFLENFTEIKNILDIGDFIGIIGKIYKTQAGEITVQVNKLFPLRKAINPLPDKWQGIQNEDLKVRLRYLDIISDQDVHDTIVSRFKIINTIKTFLINKGFLEVETPILQPIASGAAANPFKTHHKALDMDLFLRICPELYLKRLLVAGMNKVFEIAKCFRNEGLDPTHLQEFTMLEAYNAYISYEDAMDMNIDLLKTIARCISEDLIITDGENVMNFNNIPKITYIDFLKQYGNIDFDRLSDENYIVEIAKINNIDISECKSPQILLDTIYKYSCVKKIVSPILVYDYPRHALATVKEEDNRFSKMYQIILKGMEVVKGYSELNDPDLLEKNFEEQKKFEDMGDDDVVRTDYDFIEALRYGMPPACGFGLGIDRLITILTKNSSIRNVIIFPQIKEKIQ